MLPPREGKVVFFSKKTGGAYYNIIIISHCNGFRKGVNENFSERIQEGGARGAKLLLRKDNPSVTAFAVPGLYTREPCACARMFFITSFKRASVDLQKLSVEQPLPPLCKGRGTAAAVEGLLLSIN